MTFGFYVKSNTANASSNKI